MRLEVESQLITKLWTFIVASFLVWAVVLGFIAFRLRETSSPGAALPASSTIPVIDQEKIANLQTKLDNRTNQILTATPAANFRPEPFD